MNKQTPSDKTQSNRCWFCVLNNPQKQFGNIEPLDMVNACAQLWMVKNSRSCAMNFESSDSGTPHIHMVLYDASKSRFSAIQKLYPTIHIEPMYGSKEQALAYISKQGKFSEKQHTVVVPAQFFGNILAEQGKRNDVHGIEEMIEAGYTPNQIMDSCFSFRKFEKSIRSAFFSKRSKETPPMRDINVTWHVGNSGTGKSFTYTKLVEEHGEENVYLMTDYENGGLDMYCAEPILFMDEFKGNMRFQLLLNYIDKYKIQIHCRYANAFALWYEVHITSIYPPDEVYQFMIESEGRNKERDRIQQLLRRINTIVYHYKENGEYKTFSLAMEQYKGYEHLQSLALGKVDENGYLQIDDNDIPFKED